tara:strand:+ start:143 stop:607 length:465 start_codon:yes stop_codon:yes gene_type:complete
MPKNKFGGNKSKKGKNIVEKKELVLDEEGELFAQVSKVLGNKRFEVRCSDGKTRVGILRGSMKRNQWVNRLDVVLIEAWDFQNEKCSILHKYSYDDYYELMGLKRIPENFVLEEDQDKDLDDFNPFDINDSDDEDIDLSDDPDNEKKEIDIDDI